MCLPLRLLFLNTPALSVSPNNREKRKRGEMKLAKLKLKSLEIFFTQFVINVFF